MIDNNYTFSNDLASQLWHQKAPIRRIDTSLGRPILVTDDEGNYLKPLLNQHQDSEHNDAMYLQQLQATATLQQHETITSLLASNWMVALEERNESVSGTGIFTTLKIFKHQYLGTYNGTVWDEETWDHNVLHQAEMYNEDYVFSLHDGAHAVVLDGSMGPGVNALRHLNHGCTPNVLMHEMYVEGCWHVLIFALQDIAVGVELLHDYKLTTEDEDDERLKIVCRCGSLDCKGLFRLVTF